MRTLILLLTSVLLFSPITADAQDNRAALEAVAKALGATGLKSIEIQGGGTVFQVGQAYTAGTAWPQFNVRSFTRVINYDTASLRDDILRTRALEPPKGGGPYVRGEHRQVFVLSGDHAWNVMGETTAPAPNAAPMSPPSPFTVSLAENITKQGLAVDQILPLHGRMVPLAEMHKAAGVAH